MDPSMSLPDICHSWKEQEKVLWTDESCRRLDEVAAEAEGKNRRLAMELAKAVLKYCEALDLVKELWKNVVNVMAEAWYDHFVDGCCGAGETCHRSFDSYSVLMADCYDFEDGCPVA